MKIRTLIVDDEPHAIEIIERYAANVPEIEIIATASNAIKAYQFLQTNEVDLIFLDIKMPGLSGTDLVRSLKTPPMIVLTTAYPEHAMEGFELDVVDYLLKPIEQEELAKAIQKFRHQRQSTDGQPVASENLVKMLEEFGIKPVTYKSRFLIKQGGRFDVVETSDILYLYADDKVVFLITNQNRKYIVDETLDELEAKLDPRHFCRINRKYITHLSAIERIEPYFNGRLRIWLKHRPSEEEVSVSRERADSFKGWLNT